MIEWRPLDIGALKINFDAAFEERQYRSASGLVVRDSIGMIVVSITSLHMEIALSFAAEALACSQAIQIGLEMGINNVEIKEDALTIIQKCQSNVVDKSAIFAYINDIQQYKRRFQKITFIHAPRSANLTPHLLAKESLKRNKVFYKEGELLEFMRQRLGP